MYALTDELTRSIANVVAELRRIEGSGAFNRILAANSLSHTGLQAAFNLRFGAPLERLIYEIIIVHAQRAEKLGPGAFMHCIRSLIMMLSGQMGCKPLQRPESPLKDVLAPGSASQASIDDLESFIDRLTSGVEPMIGQIVRSAMNLAGYGGRIVVEKARDDRPSVELVRGYTFEHVPTWPMNVRLIRPKVACIDGIIDGVSEVHHLLEEAFDAKTGLIVFVRGLADDVKQTLRVNNDRGTLCVLPIVVRFDINGINAMNDIAIVSNANLTSSTKGDLISSVRLGDLNVVDDVMVSGDKVTLFNGSTRLAVAEHVSFLMKKRVAEHNDELAALFDTRIRALSPNHVVVRLVDDASFVASSQAVDYTLRTMRSLIDHGMTVVDEQRELVAIIAASEAYASKCYSMLVSLGGAIIT